VWTFFRFILPTIINKKVSKVLSKSDLDTKKEILKESIVHLAETKEELLVTTRLKDIKQESSKVSHELVVKENELAEIIKGD
jgi:hypothetical protein